MPSWFSAAVCTPSSTPSSCARVRSRPNCHSQSMRLASSCTLIAAASSARNSFASRNSAPERWVRSNSVSLGDWSCRNTVSSHSGFSTSTSMASCLAVAARLAPS